MTETLSIRIPTEMAKALRDHERDTMVPTSRFVRKIIERELEKKAQGNGIA